MHAEATMTPVHARGPQHLQALERANAVRLARAELKRHVAEGRVSAAAVILDSPWEAHSMTVADLLTCQRRWGVTRCSKVLQCLQIPENKRIGTMTERQRHALAAALVEAERSCRAERVQERRAALEPVLVAV